MWKAGFTKQSIQLNEYALKHEPLYAQIAAYNLGAIAEHDGEYKQALTLYEWAGKRCRQLEGYASTDAIAAKSLNELPPAYIERAIADTQENVKLKGNAIAWRGWLQGELMVTHNIGFRKFVLCARSVEHKNEWLAVKRLSSTTEGQN